MNAYGKIDYLNSSGIMQRLLSRPASEFVSSCIQKLNWNIDDFNYTLSLGEKGRKDVVYLIVLADWISECSVVLHRVYSKYGREFNYENDDELRKMLQWLKAIRSFVVAHPLCTDRHCEFGYDGSKKAIDIWMGVLAGSKCDDSRGRDFYIAWCCYDDITYSFEGHSFREIHECVRAIVDELNCFMRYLSKIRLKDLSRFD